MKNQNLLIFFLMLTFSIVSCDIDQTREGELPEVDVDMTEGQMPAYDVDWADINVGTTTRTVKVPKVRVIMEEEEVEIPYIDLDMPNEGEKEEITLVAEAEVEGQTHELDIVEVYATGNRLYVISELESTGENLEEERMRVSDRLVVNAPDLEVRHYIIGQRPAGEFNNQYRYISSRNELSDKLKNGKTIYRADS